MENAGNKKASGPEEKKRIGVLGGTFSPIHRGHIFLARYALTHCNLEKVILIPAGRPPHKQGIPIVSGEHRLAMTKLAAQDIPGLEVSDVEIRRPSVSYTYDTLCDLQKSLGKEYEILFITGTDELLGFEHWYKSRALFERFGFIVGIRPGFERQRIQDKIDFLTGDFKARIELLDLPAPDISASQIRKYLQEDLPIQELLDEKVIRYIEEKGLYR